MILCADYSKHQILKVLTVRQKSGLESRIAFKNKINIEWFPKQFDDEI